MAQLTFVDGPWANIQRVGTMQITLLCISPSVLRIATSRRTIKSQFNSTSCVTLLFLLLGLIFPLFSLLFQHEKSHC